MNLVDRLVNALDEDACTRYPPCLPEAVHQAEKELQLKFPWLLVECLTKVGNGGFGPGYGVIGIQGNESDFGDLVNTCTQIRRQRDQANKQWVHDLLPFCTWGGNIFACVDCKTTDVWILRGEAENELEKTSMSLEAFFSRWLDGASGTELLESFRFAKKSIIVRDPVTGKDIEVFSGP